MELEFSHESLICRLDNMKEILGKGELDNQRKIKEVMGEAFEESKKKHKILQA